jgi:hypothetical protein
MGATSESDEHQKTGAAGALACTIVIHFQWAGTKFDSAPYRNLVKFCANGFVDIGKAIDNGIDERLENSLSRSELFCLGVDWMSYSGKKSTTVVI